MCFVLCGMNNGKSPVEVGKEIGLTEEQVSRIYRDIQTKRKTTLPLHHRTIPMESVPISITEKVHSGMQDVDYPDVRIDVIVHRPQCGVRSKVLLPRPLRLGKFNLPARIYLTLNDLEGEIPPPGKVLNTVT
jgi:hypothetical protein